MTFAERCTAVEALGFTARQATFLTTVALHSGYCLGRQYAACAGIKNMRSVRVFVESLVERKFATRVVFRADRSIIYHLFGHRLYTAIDERDNGNRRHASPPAIAQKLMLLDFALAHPEFDWFPTQAIRTELFVARLGVALSGRVAVPRLPIFLHGETPSVNFVCVVTDTRASSIDAFVREHASLLRQLTNWTLHAVIPERISSDEACGAAYSRALGAASMSVLSASKEDLEWFASTRPLVASGDLRTLGVADLRRYRALASSLDKRLETQIVKPLVVHHLPHSYTQFGFFAGLT